MQKLVLILLGMASLAASGIITDRVRNGLDIIGGLGAQLQQIHGKLSLCPRKGLHLFSKPYDRF